MRRDLLRDDKLFICWSCPPDALLPARMWPRTFHAKLPTSHFLFKALTCWTRLSISSALSLLAYLGMRPLPLVMMLRRSSEEVSATFSEIRDGPPKWRPSAVLP